jgi:hypothetical protein
MNRFWLDFQGFKTRDFFDFCDFSEALPVLIKKFCLQRLRYSGSVACRKKFSQIKFAQMKSKLHEK